MGALSVSTNDEFQLLFQAVKGKIRKLEFHWKRSSDKILENKKKEAKKESLKKNKVKNYDRPNHG